jgi:hypothetical protein
VRKSNKSFLLIVLLRKSDSFFNTLHIPSKGALRLWKIHENLVLTKGCFVSQCLKTFKTLIVEAVLTIVYSFVFCSLEPDARGFPLVDGCGDAELPPKIIYNY